MLSILLGSSEVVFCDKQPCLEKAYILAPWMFICSNSISWNKWHFLFVATIVIWNWMNRTAQKKYVMTVSKTWAQLREAKMCEKEIKPGLLRFFIIPCINKTLVFGGYFFDLAYPKGLISILKILTTFLFSSLLYQRKLKRNNF